MCFQLEFFLISMLFLTFVMFPQIFESFYRSFFGPRPSMGDHGGRREKTGDGAALCQGDEHNEGSKRVFVPCTDPSCKAPNCKSVGPSGVGPSVPSLLLHRTLIKPPIHPPTLTLPTHHLIHPDGCLQ